MRTFVTGSLLLLFLFAVTASGQTVYYVNAVTGSDGANGSVATPFRSITKALKTSAGSADSIKVAPGTYDPAHGEIFPIDMPSGRRLIGTGGANVTIVDASGSKQRVFNCNANAAGTVIQGFTITGGFAIDTTSGGVTGKGGGIAITGNSLTLIQQNIITRDTARGYDFYQAGIGALNGGSCYGGGIYISGSAPTIRNNVISYNLAYGGGGKDFRGGWSGNGSAGGNADGGGIHAAFGGASVIVNNTFVGNTAVGGFGGSSNALNAGNGGNAVAGALNAGSSAVVSNNIFYSNSAVGGTTGGGANGANGTASDGALTGFTAANYANNLFFANVAATAPNGGTLGSAVVLSDPLFVSATNFHLQVASPARNAGTASGAPAVDFDGKTRPAPPSIGAFETSSSTAVQFTAAVQPAEFSLAQNYPNPFNPGTVLRYQLSASGTTTLRVFDAVGRVVAELVNAVKEPGSYAVSFDGAHLPSGMYIAHLSNGGRIEVRRMLLIK